jgi:hypothetical protein
MRVQTILAAALAACGGNSALAGVTAFNPLVGGGAEPSLRSIFGSVYGGSFNQVGVTHNFSNGLVTVSRVDDFFNAINPVGLQMVNGSTFGTADDNKWSDGTVTLRFETKYAANANTLGWYNNNVSSSTFLPLLGSTPGSSTTTTLSSNFEWGLKSVSGSGTQYWQSNKFDNADGMDHFVAYKVTGLAGGTRWLLAVEDLPQGASDFDYNDWVGEIEIVVPVPAAAWLGLAGLGGFAGLRWLRRRGS